MQREKHITHLWGGTANPWNSLSEIPYLFSPKWLVEATNEMQTSFWKADLNYIARSVHAWIVKLITAALKQQECLMHGIKVWQLVGCELLKQVSDLESAGASDTTGAAVDWKEDHHLNRLWHKPDPTGCLVYEDVLHAFIFFLLAP